MNIIEILTAIKENEDAKNLFSEIIIDLFKEDDLFRTAVTEFIKNDISFQLITQDQSDYYNSYTSISLEIDGYTVSSDTLATSRRE